MIFFPSSFLFLQTSYRGRKALNLGGVVSPRAKQTKAANSPAPAAVPQQSPNATSGLNQQQNQQQANLIGITTTQITAQQPQQQSQQTNIQQIPSSTVQTMKEQPQQPMVSSFYFYSILNEL
jgi:hypothetical protein